jgi:glyoxylase-like metal-dependent hydrolase (beta-lactamase superfamily II)
MCPLGGPLVDAPGSLLTRGRMVCHCLLIETPSSGLVLVDTGFGLDDMRDPVGRAGRAFVALTAPKMDPAQAAISQVRALGFSPSDVRHILLTHMDLDHAGGLADFPSARVHVMQDELDEALDPKSFGSRGRYKSAQWAHGPSWCTHKPSAGERWFGFECVRALEGLPEEILMVPLSGHSRGHAAIAVQSGGLWHLHCGDAYFHHGELETAYRCPTGLKVFQRIVAYDDALRRANQGRLRDLVSAHGREARVFCAHDPTELSRAIDA